MQQRNGKAATTNTYPLASGTGPTEEAITGVGIEGIAMGSGDECSATVVLHVTHSKVIATATLNMGGVKTAQRVLERRRGHGSGWVVTKGADGFVDDAGWISAELAELADRLPFPYAVANMLPGSKARAESVAQAAQEVAHG